MRPVHLVVLCGAAAALAFTAVRPAVRGTPRAPARPETTLLGRPFPTAVLESLHGQSAAELESGRGPLLVYIVDSKNFIDCTQVPLEMRIVRRSFPRMRQVFVAVGDDTLAAVRYAAGQRIPGTVLIDRGGRVLKAMGSDVSPPLTLLVNSEDRIVLVDARFGGDFSRYPISRLLPTLAATLDRSPALPGDGRRIADGG